jgi:hypothetical protein
VTCPWKILFPEKLLVRASSIEVTKGMILAMKRNIWRAVLEVSFIIFLFYSNLLMGNLSVQVWG